MPAFANSHRNGGGSGDSSGRPVEHHRERSLGTPRRRSSSIQRLEPLPLESEPERAQRPQRPGAACRSVSRPRSPAADAPWSTEMTPFFARDFESARRRTRRAAVPLAVAAVAATLTTAGALAAPVVGTLLSPPPAGHSVIAFPERDFVSATGYERGIPATVEVIKPNGDLFTAHELPQDDPGTPEFDGLVEVNHPGAACWIDRTPD